MKKVILFVSAIYLLIGSVNGQNIEELQTINNKSKFQFVKPESLDQLLISLRKYESAPDRKHDTLLLETYKNIASAYMANNHFKKAYEVYNRYLLRKENMLSAYKSDFLSKTINSVSSRKENDEKQELVLQNKLDNLKEDNSNLESRQSFFKRNFSLGLIILTAVFALILVSTGLRMITIRTNLQKNRDRMKNIHQLAVTGSFGPGLRNGLKSNLITSEEKTVELHQLLKNQDQNFGPAKEGKQILSGIEKTFKNIMETLS